MKDFMGSLNYASCNEDWRSEWDALMLGPEDRVLCITGSGDRPLDLLPKGPKSIASIDMNPVQNHLLRLKMAAMEALPYEEYASFIGLAPGGDRSRSWDRVKGSLPEGTREFWTRHMEVLERGIIYQGRWERHFRKLAFISKVLRGGTLKKLFEFEDLEEQRAFIHERWDRWWWRRTFDLLCSASFSKAFFGDPGFYKFVSKDMTLGEYVFDGMNEYLLDHLAKESFMVSLVFLGRLSERDLPPYLSPDHVGTIVGRMGRISMMTGDVMTHMETVPEGTYTKFSLSDVPSFLDQKGFERLLDGVHRSGAPGARFCIRYFLSDQKVPGRFDGLMVREPELEERLRRQDSSFAYRFLVGRVVKDGST